VASGWEPSRWRAQLAEHYARQPVFAIVSGAAEGDWTPVHEFCEQNHVPCVLPQTDVPPVEGAEDGFYSLYFSKGLALEAATLGHHLTSGREPSARGGILQVLRCGSQAEHAAMELTKALEPHSVLRTRCIDPSTRLTAATWQTVLRRRCGLLVVWLGPEDLIGLSALAWQRDALAGITRIYFSSSLIGDDRSVLSPPLLTKAFLLHPFVSPDDFNQHAWRTLAWLKTTGIDTHDRRASVNALFAATVVADALSLPRTLASRDYFVERIEHMIGRRRFRPPTLQ